jgi:NAD(P)-dependent dehydrogenase (short-subunit alcohol dehydrogenase family)
VRPSSLPCVPTDVKVEEQCAALVQRTMDEFGRIDILVQQCRRHADGPAQVRLPTKEGCDFDLNVRRPISAPAKRPAHDRQRSGAIGQYSSSGGIKA